MTYLIWESVNTRRGPIKFAKPGNHLVDIARGVQTYAESNGYSVVRDLTGHGTVSYTHLDVYKRQVEALGLKKVNKTVEMPDNDAVRGMIWHVGHLVKVEEI